MAPRFAAVLALLLVWLTGGSGQAQVAAPFLRPVGEWRSDQPSPYLTRIVRAGSLAYALDLGALDVLDVSDPTHPTRLARIDLGDRTAQALAATGSTLLVFQHPTLRLFDVADPAQPRPVGSYTSPGGDCGGFPVSAAIAVADARVYLAAGSESVFAPCPRHLTVLDLTSPAAPSELGSLTGIGPPGALRVLGTTAYIADSGPASSRHSRDYGRLRIVDAADPAQPRELGALQSSMTILQGLAVVGRHAYLTGGYTCGGGYSCHNGAKLEIVDVGDPTRPALATTVATAFGNDLETAGRYLFLAEARQVTFPSAERVGCLRVFDTADPVRPVQVAATGSVQGDFDLALDASHAYVADGDAVRVLGWVGPAPTPAPIGTPAAYRVLLPYIADAVGCDPG
jgi:hypothetical protein